MKNYSFLLAVFLACFCLAGCEGFSPFNAKKNVLIIKPSPITRSDNGLERKDGSVIYRIGEAKTFGAFPAAYICARTFGFSREDVPNALIMVLDCVQDTRLEYSQPGDIIKTIWIQGIDESLGFGNQLRIQMNQGDYEGAIEFVEGVREDATELIKSVEIISFKVPGINEDILSCDINIVITSSTGGTITFLYSGELQPIATT